MTSDYFEQAKRFIPGGVNSPVRAFTAVGGDPVFVRSARGARLYAEDGRTFIDYVGSWGPMILGHADPGVIEAVISAAKDGLSFGAPTVAETRLASLICRYMPSIERVRMVNSGTEATMSAIRLARGFTGRQRIIKFEGCYHGHSDALLVKAGSGALTLGVPSSAGVPPGAVADTLTLPYNDLDAIARVFQRSGDEIAAVIVEPIAGNMNFVQPVEGFLSGLKDLCEASGALLIFDEVMTGFRVALGGAQSVYNISPDLTCLGKIVGGGLPVGAFGGRRDVMDKLAPLGPVYQAGTLSGNPIAMVAGHVTLERLAEEDFYADLAATTGKLVRGVSDAAASAGVPFFGDYQGGMFGFFFTPRHSVTRYSDVMECDGDLFAKFFHAMLDAGIYLAPSSFEAGFVSAAHTDADIEETIAAAATAFRRIAT